VTRRMRADRTRLCSFVLGFGLLLGAQACSDRVTDPNENPTPRSIVSEPVSAAAATTVSTSGPTHHLSLAAATAQEVVYVSMPPGSLPDGVNATVRNATSNALPTPPIRLIAGGFDPVAVAATVDDVLEIRITDRGGTVSVIYDRVPKRRPPRIVRTDPPKGRTDVAFSTTIVIVLSEPIAPSTVTPGAVTLERNGQAVPARLTLASDGLQIELTPLGALHPGTTYLLRITRALADLSGDPLEAEDVVTFTTAAPVAPLPASAQIAFISTRGGDTAVYVMGPDGSGVTRVMKGSRAAWSPDGSKLAIVARGELDSDDIYILAADGSMLTRLIRGPYDEQDPAWSPNGRSIAYRRGGLLVIASSDGSGISGSLGGGSSPAWAPDGHRIAFTRMSGTWVVHAGTPFVPCARLLVTDISYTAVTPLTAAGDTTCATAPAWSPDGSRILFSMARVRGGGRELLTGFDLFPADLYSLDPDGAGLTMIFFSPDDDYAPGWSPDGSRIAFTSTQGGRAQIWVMNADGSGAANISRNAYEDSYPSWRRRQVDQSGSKE
jgi:hypothetical protein